MSEPVRRELCPTCGEKRWVPKEFGECVHCHETTNGLRGRGARSMPAGYGTCGTMKLSPYGGESADPFLP